MKTRIWIIAIAAAILLGGFSSVSYSQEKSKTPSKSITKTEKTMNMKPMMHSAQKDTTKMKSYNQEKMKSRTKMHKKNIKPKTNKDASAGKKNR
jgi:hypothetical protein